MNFPTVQKISLANIGILFGIGTTLVSGVIYAGDYLGGLAKKEELFQLRVNVQLVQADMKREIEKLGKTVRNDSLLAADKLRKQLLEDKLFELDQIDDNKKTGVQRATARRARAQLREVQERINARER